MSSTRIVPETRLMKRESLSPDRMLRALRRYGGWRLIRDAFVRFRYGDGFSHSRALALQLCLAAVPFLIALTGLATDLGMHRGGQVVADTVLALTPGRSDSLVTDVLAAESSKVERASELALVIGLLTGMVALTMAMAQIERGANRIYGVERDRPVLAKYLRALVLALVAGLPALTGFLLLAAGDEVGDSLRRRYALGHAAVLAWDVARWPVSLCLTVLAVSLLFRHAPRRHQPGLSWLVPGAAVATALWWLASLLLAVYVRNSGAFGATYGPLTAVMALLLWANLTGVALFLGLSFTAQLEARRVGVPEPAQPDKWVPDDERESVTA